MMRRMENIRIYLIGSAILAALLIGGWLIYSSYQPGGDAQDATINAETNGEGESVNQDTSAADTSEGASLDGGMDAQEQRETQHSASAVPRIRAGSAEEALRYFVEAMLESDYDLAVSYFSKNVQDSYKGAFSEHASGARFSVVQAYINGKVDRAEVVDPANGIYEIAVYPAGSQLAFRPRLAYDSSVGEFVILEL